MWDKTLFDRESFTNSPKPKSLKILLGVDQCFLKVTSNVTVTFNVTLLFFSSKSPEKILKSLKKSKKVSKALKSYEMF